MQRSRNGWVLAGILLVGVCLRFWHLDLKPLWLDEVITTLFSLGRSYNDVPIGRLFSGELLEQILTLQPGTTCGQIVQTVSVQSVHPPLFFCWMHQWLGWIQPLPVSDVWKLRSFAALIGVVAIAAIYQLNRIAFSPIAAILGAAFMAVSPFAVYLSQEARHYTLPMLLVTLALLALYHLLQDLATSRYRPAVWLGWIGINGIGFYVHYFFLLALGAQVVALATVYWQQRQNATPDLPDPNLPDSSLKPFRSVDRGWLAIGLALLAVCLICAPWSPTFLSHLGRPETDWMQPYQPSWIHRIAPLYQLLFGWVVLLVLLPIEHQPLPIQIASGAGMLLVFCWVSWRLGRRLRWLWQAPETALATRLLATYALVVLLEFLAIVYVLGKDITQVPRYNFIYFPAVCALVGACLSLEWRSWQVRRKVPVLVVTVLLAGIVSSLGVTANLSFLKPYEPDRVAQTLSLDPELPRLVALVYANLQDIALELSFALALHQQDTVRPTNPRSTQFVLLQRPPNTPDLKQSFVNLQPLESPLNFWMITPGIRRQDFPPQVLLPKKAGGTSTCEIDPTHHYRVGIPYQLYRCR